MTKSDSVKCSTFDSTLPIFHIFSRPLAAEVPKPVGHIYVQDFANITTAAEKGTQSITGCSLMMQRCSTSCDD